MGTEHEPDLRRVTYFSRLDQTTLERVVRSATRLSYDEGQVILLEGEPCSGLYIVASGHLKAVKTGLDGREQVLQTLGPGDAFNAVGVLADSPNQATVLSLEPSAVWLIRREVLLGLMDEYPELARDVVRDLAERVMHLVQLVEDLSLRSVEARLARLLLEQEQGGSVYRERWATQAEMATRLGTVPDVINRALRDLVKRGLIDVERREIRILDRDRLAGVARVSDPVRPARWESR
jgi:CRP/FNR family transcriptional regulator